MILEAVCTEESVILDPHLDNVLNVLFSQVSGLRSVWLTDVTGYRITGGTVRVGEFLWFLWGGAEV